MKKKIIGILIIILLISITIFIIENFKKTEPPKESPIESPVETAPHLTSNETINRIIFDSVDIKSLKEKFGPSVLNENSLINLVHIIKEESDYKIACEFGLAYKTANLNKFYPEELVSMGQIKECTVEIAKVIDEVINSPEEDCRIPLTTLDPGARRYISSLKDYYLVTVEFKEDEVTQELVDKFRGVRCFEPLKDLIGEKIAVSFITGIVDLKTNKIFY